MRSTLVVLLLLIGLASAKAYATDAKAKAEIEKMLAAVGGRDIWRDASGFEMTEILYDAGTPLPVIRRYAVDFRSPRIKETSVGSGLRRTNALNDVEGWTDENGVLMSWPAERHARWRSFWPGIPTRIFHLVASNDPSVTAKWRDGVLDFYIGGDRVVWIGLDENGVPVAYGRADRHTETHFLGKPMRYGDVTLWSEATEPGGEWRVVMVDYVLMREPMAESFAPPKR